MSILTAILVAMLVVLTIRVTIIMMMIRQSRKTPGFVAIAVIVDMILISLVLIYLGVSA